MGIDKIPPKSMGDLSPIGDDGDQKLFMGPNIDHLPKKSGLEEANLDNPHVKEAIKETNTKAILAIVSLMKKNREGE